MCIRDVVRVGALERFNYRAGSELPSNLSNCCRAES